MPIDYVEHNSNDTLKWFNIPDHSILILWKINYWVTFLLTWLVLPILQEFYKSGQFKSYSRFIEAIRKNFRFQMIILGVSILGLIYLTLEVGLSLNHLKLLIIAISHIYGLIIVLWLMAHGLINIARNRWTFGNHMTKVNYYYLKVPKLVDNLEDCKISFKEDILKVLVLYNYINNDEYDNFMFRDWIIELYNKIPADLKELMELQINNNLYDSNLITRNDINNGFLKNLTSSFNMNYNKLVAYESEFNVIFNEIILLEDLSASNLNSLNFRIDKVTKLKFIWLNWVKPILNRALSIFFFVVSFMIIESEFFHSTKLSIIDRIYNKINNNSLKFMVTFSIFAYMLICSLNSLTQLKIFNMYHLVTHKSDPISACFYATYIARLTIPLSYNFITLFISRKSIFEDWFGKSIHLTGLFNLMNNWIPRLLFIPIILTIFNVYDKIKRKLGLNNDFYDSLSFDDDNNDSTKRKDLIIVEAKRIINREVNKRLSNSVTPIRSYNLQSAADMNYEANRNNFESLLINSNNRIEFSDNIDTPSIWANITNQFNNIRNQFSRSSYRDEPLEDFEYDDDADHDLVI